MADCNLVCFLHRKTNQTHKTNKQANQKALYRLTIKLTASVVLWKYVTLVTSFIPICCIKLRQYPYADRITGQALMWTELHFSEIRFLVHEQKESSFVPVTDQNCRAAFP